MFTLSYRSLFLAFYARVCLSMKACVLASDKVHGFTSVLTLLAKPRPVAVHRLDLLAIKVRDRVGQWVTSRVSAVQDDSVKELSVHLESKKKKILKWLAHSRAKNNLHEPIRPTSTAKVRESGKKGQHSEKKKRGKLMQLFIFSTLSRSGRALAWTARKITFPTTGPTANPSKPTPTVPNP